MASPSAAFRARNSCRPVVPDEPPSLHASASSPKTASLLPARTVHEAALEGLRDEFKQNMARLCPSSWRLQPYMAANDPVVPPRPPRGSPRPSCCLSSTNGRQESVRRP